MKQAIHMFLEQIHFKPMMFGLSALKPDWLEHDISLYLLEIKEFNVIKIEEDAFNSNQFKYLNELRLEGAPISTLSSQSFNGLSNLKTLSLVSLRIFIIIPNPLEYLLNLRKFIMRKCVPRKISIDKIFGTENGAKLYNLDEVEIEDCNLGDTITASTFTKLTNISKLRLNSNKIDKIGQGAFDIPLRTLQYLSLQSNNLTMVPENIFRSKSDRIIEIFLGQNPWHCDYKMDHLREFIRSTSKAHFDRVLCTTPPEYSAKLLTSLSTLNKILNIQIPAQVARPLRKPSRKKTHPSLVPTDIPDEIVAIDTDGRPIEDVNQAAFFDDTNQDENDDNTNKKTDIGKSFIVQCHTPHTWKLSVTLTKPFYEAVQDEHNKRSINSKIISNDAMFITLQQIRTMNQQNIVKCKSIMKKVRKTPFDMTIMPNQMNRLCMLDKWVTTITPLNCLAFFLYQEETDLWILRENRSMMIATFLLFGVSALVLGILVALFIAIFFPTLIRPIQGDSINNVPNPALKMVAKNKRPHNI